MNIAIIVATDEQGVIGHKNGLPWHIPADLHYFRRVTMGKPLIMGRNTHESIGRPLPGRKNIVITRNVHYQTHGCEVVYSVDDALATCQSAEEIIVMGGASLYQQFLPMAKKLYLTRIHARFEGDAWFPEWDVTHWRELNREDHRADENNDYDYSFIVYERISD